MNATNSCSSNSPSCNQQITSSQGNGSDVEGVDDLPPPPGSRCEVDNGSSTISPTTTTNGSSVGIPHANGSNLHQNNGSQRLLVSPRPIPRKNGGFMPGNPDIQVELLGFLESMLASDNISADLNKYKFLHISFNRISTLLEAIAPWTRVCPKMM